MTTPPTKIDKLEEWIEDHLEKRAGDSPGQLAFNITSQVALLLAQARREEREPLEQRIHDLEQVCDPSGDLRQNRDLQEQRGALCQQVEELRELLDQFRRSPQGCRCPNNGGGDCDWCCIASEAAAALRGEKP